MHGVIGENMLSSLFPYGFILIAVLAFVVFVLGGFAGIFVGVGLKIHEEGRIERGPVICVIMFMLVVGIALSFLYYHFIWNMMCRQFTFC